MEKYAVFAETVFVPDCELSISNRIVGRISGLTILEIVRDWLAPLYPNVKVIYNGTSPNIDNLSVHDMSSDIAYRLIAIHKESNVRLQMGVYKTTYTAKKVG